MFHFPYESLTFLHKSFFFVSLEFINLLLPKSLIWNEEKSHCNLFDSHLRYVMTLLSLGATYSSVCILKKIHLHLSETVVFVPRWQPPTIAAPHSEGQRLTFTLTASLFIFPSICAIKPKEWDVHQTEHHALPFFTCHATNWICHTWGSITAFPPTPQTVWHH